MAVYGGKLGMLCWLHEVGWIVEYSLNKKSGWGLQVNVEKCEAEGLRVCLTMLE